MKIKIRNEGMARLNIKSVSPFPTSKLIL